MGERAYIYHVAEDPKRVDGKSVWLVTHPDDGRVVCVAASASHAALFAGALEMADIANGYYSACCSDVEDKDDLCPLCKRFDGLMGRVFVKADEDGIAVREWGGDKEPEPSGDGTDDPQVH